MFVQTNRSTCVTDLKTLNSVELQINGKNIVDPEFHVFFDSSGNTLLGRFPTPNGNAFHKWDISLVSQEAYPNLSVYQLMNWGLSEYLNQKMQSQFKRQQNQE